MIKILMNLFGKILCIFGIYALSDDENVFVKEDIFGILSKQ